MNIKVKIGGSLKRTLGQGEMIVDLPSKSTLGDLFGKLKEEVGIDFFQQVPMIIIVGDRDYRFIGGFAASLDEKAPVLLVSSGGGRITLFKKSTIFRRSVMTV